MGVFGIRSKFWFETWEITGNLSIDDRIIKVEGKVGVRACTGFIEFRIGSNSRHV
jgi:hypothetical protein